MPMQFTGAKQIINHIYIESPANILDLVTLSTTSQDRSVSRLQVKYVEASTQLGPLKEE